MEGIVLYWSEKGYGKIRGDDDVAYFFHYRYCKSPNGERVNFEKWDSVRFTPSKNSQGPLAVDVEKA